MQGEYYAIESGIVIPEEDMNSRQRTVITFMSPQTMQIPRDLYKRSHLQHVDVDMNRSPSDFAGKVIYHPNNLEEFKDMLSEEE